MPPFALEQFVLVFEYLDDNQQTYVAQNLELATVLFKKLPRTTYYHLDHSAKYFEMIYVRRSIISKLKKLFNTYHGYLIVDTLSALTGGAITIIDVNKLIQDHTIQEQDEDHMENFRNNCNIMVRFVWNSTNNIDAVGCNYRITSKITMIEAKAVAFRLLVDAGAVVGNDGFPESSLDVAFSIGGVLLNIKEWQTLIPAILSVLHRTAKGYIKMPVTIAVHNSNSIFTHTMSHITRHINLKEIMEDTFHDVDRLIALVASLASNEEYQKVINMSLDMFPTTSVTSIPSDVVTEKEVEDLKIRLNRPDTTSNAQEITVTLLDPTDRLQECVGKIVKLECTNQQQSFTNNDHQSIQITMKAPNDNKNYTFTACKLEGEIWCAQTGDVRVENNILSFTPGSFGAFAIKKNIKYAESSLVIDEGMLDHRWDRVYDDIKEAEIGYNRGGKKYYLPYGFRRIGVKCPNFELYENWCVAFHGTTFDRIASILRDGFLRPLTMTSHGDITIRPREGHIQLGDVIDGDEDFANAIFLSPSYLYSSCEVYAKTHIVRDKKFKVLLQVRVRPGSYKVYKETIGAEKKQIDPHFDNNELEWIVKNPADVVVYGVLIKEITAEKNTAEKSCLVM
jgi:hypothetical protein